MSDLLQSLNINPTILLMNVGLFLVLLLVMNALFWKPMLKHLETRKENIADAYKTVEDTRREMENLRSEYQGRLARLEADARGRIQAAVRDAQTQREGLIAEARHEAEGIVQDGAKAIAEEHDQTVEAMRGRLADVTAETLMKALGTEADPAQRRLVEEFIAGRTARS